MEEDTFCLERGTGCKVLRIILFAWLNWGNLDLEAWSSSRLFGKRSLQLLTFDDQQAQASSIDIIWKKSIPLKVSLFAWRLMDRESQLGMNWLDRCGNNFQPGSVFARLVVKMRSQLLTFFLDYNFFFFWECLVFHLHRLGIYTILSLLSLLVPFFGEGYMHLFSNNLNDLHLDIIVNRCVIYRHRPYFGTLVLIFSFSQSAT